MIAEFKQHLFKNLQIGKNDPVLLAVSGGLDSTVMAWLFHEAGLRFAMAHCNFQLRGRDSNDDEAFVKKLAEKLGVEFHTTRFATTDFAEAKKISVQEAARELRYQWLQAVATDKHYRWIATAHHQDDSIETMLFNLIKGCGIRGLHGILPKQKNIIRPLMFTRREALEKWAKEKGLQWREDVSNASDKYDRNKIRHHVIPEMEKINPSFRSTALASIRRFTEAQEIVEHFVAEFRDRAFEMVNGKLGLKKAAFAYGNANRTLLYELLAPYGFNNHQTDQMLSRFDAPPGGIFYSPTHKVLNDRDYLVILSNNDPREPTVIEIAEGDEEVKVPGGRLVLQKTEEVPGTFNSDANTAWFDAGKLKFPLILRRWKAGDRFQPLGMGGKSKKVQDLLSDSKLSRFDKEQVWILESQGNICWIVGLRTDERFKIEDCTSSCLKIRWIPDSFVHQHHPANQFHLRKS